jgi:hypothetical protein
MIMKKFMKIAAVAAAALAMLVSCEKNEEKAPLTIEGKQWVFDQWYDKVDGKDIYTPAVLDLGVQEAGMIILGQKSSHHASAEYTMNFFPAEYTIEKTSETSGVIKFECYGMEDEYHYSELTENSVKLSGGIFEIKEGTVATLATTKIVIAE